MERRNFLKALLGVAGAATAVTILAPAAEAAPALTPDVVPAADAALADENAAKDVAELGKDEDLPEADQTQYYVVRRRYYRPRRVYVRRRYYRPRRVYYVRRRRPVYRVRRVYWY